MIDARRTPARELPDLTPAEAEAAADEIYERWLANPAGSYLSESVDLDRHVAAMLGSYGQAREDNLQAMRSALLDSARRLVARWTPHDIADFRDHRALAAELVAGL